MHAHLPAHKDADYDCTDEDTSDITDVLTQGTR